MANINKDGKDNFNLLKLSRFSLYMNIIYLYSTKKNQQQQRLEQ